MGRKRSRKSQGLEPNLYQDKHSFIYRNPITGKRTRVNRSLADANALARKANSRLMRSDELSLLAKMTNSESAIFGDICDRFYADIVENSNNKQGTKENKQYIINRFKKDLAKQPIDAFSVKQLSEYLEAGFSNDSYIKHRALLIDVFKYAKARGLYEGENPAAATLEKTAGKKVRKRHSWEGIQKIIKGAEPWLQRAIKVALYTLQRREDLVEIRKDQIQGDYIFLKQNKTEGEQFDKTVYLKIRMGDELKQVIKECLSSPIPSPYLIHYKPKRIYRENIKHKDHWTCVTPDYLTKQFAKVRNQVKAYPKMTAAEQPTFHELRAFGSWVYEHRAGFDHDYVQMLMGHTSGKMTSEYQEGHEIKYQLVEAGLALSGLDI